MSVYPFSQFLERSYYIVTIIEKLITILLKDILQKNNLLDFKYETTYY